LERRIDDRALAFAALDVVIAVEEHADAQSACDKRSARQRAQRRAELKCFLIVRLNLRVALAVVETEVKVAKVVRQVRVERHARVRGREEAFAFGEHGALEAIAVDALLVIDERRLLDAEAHPRLLPVARPVIERVLPEQILGAEFVAAVETGAAAGLARD